MVLLRAKKAASIDTSVVNPSEHTTTSRGSPPGRSTSAAGHEPPPAVRRGLDAAGLNHRPILLAVDTDVGLDGTPAHE